MLVRALGPWAWLLLFAGAWAAFLLLSDLRSLRRYWIGGVLFAHRGLWFEVYFTNRGLWEHGAPLFPVVPLSDRTEWLLILGPYFVLGVLLYRFLPWKRRELLFPLAILVGVGGILIDSTAAWLGLLKTTPAFQPLKHSFHVWLTWEGFLVSKFFALGLDTDGPVRPRSWQWAIWILPPAALIIAFLWSTVTILTAGTP